jgi:hypothetical protein
MIFEVFISLFVMVLSSLWLEHIYLHVANDVSKDYNSIFFLLGYVDLKKTLCDVLQAYCR